MHPTFYHWHARAEFKPEVAILEARWNAAKKFATDLPTDDVGPLLNVVLFSGSEPDFVSRLSAAIVVLEPTFNPRDNAELVRVMATAAAYSIMESSSDEADAIALGLQAAAFPTNRVEPVCSEIMEKASEYLGGESERVRPELGYEEDDESFSELVQLVHKEEIEGTENIDTTIAESVVSLGQTVRRLTEENQFLWWLVGQQSPICKARREKLKPDAYALVAAVEAETRVGLLPPAASVEALLEDAVLQCGDGKSTNHSLTHYVNEAAGALGKIDVETPSVAQLTPINSVRVAHSTGVKVDKGFLKTLKIPHKHEVSCEGAARQYFRELVFLRALRNLS